MFTLRKKYKFEAAHQLKNIGGKCARLHGHSWKMAVEIIGEVPPDDKNNIVVDFDYISKVVKPLVEDKLDHWYLNESLNTDSPSSEFVAKWIYDYLKPYFQGPNYYLKAVEVSETCTSSCRYEEK
jgi:6-pyruvoyltetrahydropterin/6-carboxytetrahydropterin synthase